MEAEHPSSTVGVPSPLSTGKGKGKGAGGAAGGSSSLKYHWNASHAGSHYRQYPSDMKARLLNISTYFHTNKLEISHSYDRLHESNFDVSQVLMVSFEALINPVAPPPVLHNTHHHSSKPDIVSAAAAAESTNITTKYSILREMLEFMKFEQIFNERVECAYKFMEVGNALQELQQMNSYFLSHHHLICEMNKIFNVVLSRNKFRFIRLYSEVDCGQQQDQQQQNGEGGGWL